METKNKIEKYKNITWNFIEKNSFIIFLCIITALSLVLRITMHNYVSGDYELFLKPWFDELKANRWVTCIK